MEVKKTYTCAMSTEHPLDKAARIVGTQAELARRLGVTKGALNQWKDEGRGVPARHCPSIERETGGQVRCEELCADVDWAVLRRRVKPKSRAPEERAESATADAQE